MCELVWIFPLGGRQLLQKMPASAVSGLPELGGGGDRGGEEEEETVVNIEEGAGELEENGPQLNENISIKKSRKVSGRRRVTHLIAGPETRVNK